MASVFRTAGSKKYTIVWYDETGKRHKKAGCTDKAESTRIGNELENRKALRKAGLTDPKAEAFRDHEATPLARHIADWQANLVAEGSTSKHAEAAANRVRRLATVILGASPSKFDPRKLPPGERRDMTSKLAAAIGRARLSTLTRDAVQYALGKFRDDGVALQTCNHYRASSRAFSRWCFKAGRLRVDELQGVTGFNAKEDRRHDRRTLGLDDLQRLIDATHRGPEIAGLPGPVRALCYRLAVASGLRYSELASLVPTSFDFGEAPTVTVEAAYAKNGRTATLYLPSDLATDLEDFVKALGPNDVLFPLPEEKGARMLREDLARAKIPYQDASGQFFDFHALRCQCATNADAAGVTPRVVQKLMRHSSLELTGRYTRPRAVDIQGAAARLPALRPREPKPEAAAMTGTDATPLPVPSATTSATDDEGDGPKLLSVSRVAASERQSAKPPSRVRISAAPLSHRTRLSP